VSAAARVSPAVVTITIGASSAGGPFASAGGTGSGFIYDSNGLILTNAHVVESGGAITVTLADGRSFAGTVVASDSAADLAVVRVDATGLPAVTLGSPAGLAVGSTVIAIGDPLGEYPGSVTIGVVSGLDRGITVMDGQTRTAHDLAGLIQTDAAVNEGNSGGPLVTVDGKVIGIVAAGSSSAQGIGFAIPIDRAAAIMAQAGGAAVQG
jgi:serine protease Do